MPFLTSLAPDWKIFGQSWLLILGACLLLGFLARAIFGKHSVVNRSLSAAIGILFIYVVTVVIYSTGAPLEQFLSPLPFITITGESMEIFSFAGASFPAVCSQLLSMIILAFLVNLLDGWIPQGKHFITWLLFRCLTVLGAILLHLLVNHLLLVFLPEGLMTYAPAVLLCILVLLLLTGALKVLVSLALATVNPVIAALYAFFFSTLVGKQITKAVFTTALLALLVFLLNKLGVTVISIAGAALTAYIPFLLLLVSAWYLVQKVL